MFYLEEELLELFNKSGIRGLKCESIPKGNLIALDSSDLQVLIDYAKDNKIAYLFYSYHLANKEYYLIDNTKLAKDGDLSRLAYNDIQLHNDYINSVDFEQPGVLDVFCLNNGIAINIRSYALWVDDLIPAEERISQLKQKYETVLDDIKEKRDLERDRLLDELKLILLEDAEFTLCTNQNLRREFMRKFLARKENERFKNAFFSGNGYFNLYEAGGFADIVYATYKKIGKR